MKCFKCDKEMDREGDNPHTIKGLVEDVTLTDKVPPETRAYMNKQLGKYSNGKGEAHVAICYECYIDGLFHIHNP